MKKRLWRIILSALLFMLGLILPVSVPAGMALMMAAYALIGYDVLWRAVQGIVGGQVFDENFLMSLATIGAIAIGEYPEAVAVMLF